MNRVKRLIEITPSQLKLYEAIGRDFPDLSPAQTARIVAIVREWVHDEVNTVKAELVSGNFIPQTLRANPTGQVRRAWHSTSRVLALAALRGVPGTFERV